MKYMHVRKGKNILQLKKYIGILTSKGQQSALFLILLGQLTSEPKPLRFQPKLTTLSPSVGSIFYSASGPQD